MKYVDSRNLPPCSYSPECLRLIDDLDMPAIPRSHARISSIEDLHERRLLRQLRSHVPGCPTCSTLLTETRRMRTRQRMMLHHFLIATENRVPSTAGAIFAAIQREQAQHGKEAPAKLYSSSALPDLMLVPAADSDEEPATLPASRSLPYRRIVQNMLTLATVAAVILAAVGLFNRFTNQSSTAKTPDPAPHQPAPSRAAINNYGWDSAVIGLALLSASGFTIYNFNAVSGQMTTLLTSSQDISALDMESVSGDGQALLYDVVLPDRQRMYKMFSPSSPTQDLYSLSANQGGNAIWLDYEHVLVQVGQGLVLELDTRTSSVQQQWSIPASKLVFYHQPFLYFTGSGSLNTDALYRVDLSRPAVAAQLVALANANSRFWLNPDGTTIYFVDTDAQGEQGIYAVQSDGTHEGLFRSGSGVPIGFAADGSLMVMQQSGTEIQVIKLGATPEEKEQVIFANAAPGASSLCAPSGSAPLIPLCDQDIALEPYGHGLLLHVYYADGSHSLIYDNLQTGTSQKVLSLATHANVQLPGWSRISAGATAAVTPLLQCA